MNKIISMTFMMLMMISCSTQESNSDKAKRLIKERLSKKMNDFKSYEPVEFSQLDSNFSEYVSPLSLEVDTSFGEEYLEKQRKDMEAESNFKPKFIGYKMTHSFRGKNSLGNTIIDKQEYLFDPEVTKVLDGI